MNSSIIIKPSVISNGVFDFYNKDAVKELKLKAVLLAIGTTSEVTMDLYQVMLTYLDKDCKTISVEYDVDIIMAQKEYIMQGYVDIMADIYTSNIDPKKRAVVLLPTKNHQFLYPRNEDPMEHICIQMFRYHRGKKVYQKLADGGVEEVRQVFHYPFSITRNNNLFYSSAANLYGRKGWKTMKTIGLTTEYQLVTRLCYKINQSNQYDYQASTQNPNIQMIQVHIENQFGWTPLHYACYFGCQESVAQLVMNNDIDINAKDITNETPLHKIGNFDMGFGDFYSRVNDLPSVVNHLIKLPLICIHEKNNMGETVLDKLNQFMILLENHHVKEYNDLEHEYHNDKQMMDHNIADGFEHKKHECQEIVNLLEEHQRKQLKQRNCTLSYLRNNMDNWGKKLKTRGDKRKNEFFDP
jgi:hypothetical protein